MNSTNKKALLNIKNTRVIKLLTGVFCLAVGILISALISQPIYAQTELNLTVSPPVSYLHAPPGSSRQHTIVLENSGTTPITVFPTLVDFVTDGKSGKAIVTNQLTFPYVSLGLDDSVQEVTIPPGKKAQLTLYITIPNDAQEKEYALTTLFFSQSGSVNQLTENSGSNSKEEPGETTKSSSQVSGAIGSNLIVLVAKQNTFSKLLEVVDIQAPTILESFQDISFVPLVQNNSLGAAAASGSAKIVNWRKETVAQFEIYPDTILGHNSRELRALLSDSNPEQPEVGSFTYKPSFLIGPYQIVVTLTSESGIIHQYVHVFYAVPFAILIGIILCIAISIYFTRTHKKNNTNSL